jgi:type III pantothenate kinase
MPSPLVPNWVAVDIGNSRIKLKKGSGLFSTADEKSSDPFVLVLLEPGGEFDVDRLAEWCNEVAADATWLVASVHRGAAERFAAVVSETAVKLRREWTIRQVTYRDVPMPILVDQPARVGIDRLLAALAADRLRTPGRAAVVVDCGTAITVDLVRADSSFAGGAILPGIAMSARALHEQTDALPRVDADRLDRPPAPLGASTVGAIQAGLYWGAIGAIRELIGRLSADRDGPLDVFLTGGASPHAAELLATGGARGGGPAACWSVRHVPDLVLMGIELANQAAHE